MNHKIEIDRNLLQQAMKVTGFTTRRAVVEEGLCLLIRVKAREGIRRLRGKIVFEGYASNAEEMGEQLQ